MAKKLGTNKLEPRYGMTRRKDPCKPKNKHKIKQYKKYRGQGK